MTTSPFKHDVFQAIADPTRRSMLRLISNKEMHISAITECFPISRTAVNKHLKVLSDANLVSHKKVGRETRYKLNAAPLEEVKDWLSFFDRYWDDKLFALKEFVENE
jgi:DNA-binding transcriptional ArsR family regulator